MIRSTIFLICTLFATSVEASIIRDREVVCPIGNEKFQATLQSSGTIAGRYLDMKPYGYIAAPWPIAQCPSNGFVMYKDTDEFTKSELKRLEKFVLSDKYQKMRYEHTTYYLAATLQRQLKVPKDQLANTLLQATWQAEGKLYANYADEALKMYADLLKSEPKGSKTWVYYQMISGELERRLGKFDLAAQRFIGLKKITSLTPIESQIIGFQLQLIAKRNAEPQRVPKGMQEVRTRK